MNNILKTKDKTNRVIYLTNERYKHIAAHPDMQNKLEEIKETLENPLNIIDYSGNKNIKYYYRYYKYRKSKVKYLRVVVKYLNGKGFIVTAYFVEGLK